MENASLVIPIIPRISPNVHHIHTGIVHRWQKHSHTGSTPIIPWFWGMNIHISTYIYIHKYIYMCICIYLYIYIFIFIYLYLYQPYLGVHPGIPSGPLHKTLTPVPSRRTSSSPLCTHHIPH